MLQIRNATISELRPFSKYWLFCQKALFPAIGGSHQPIVTPLCRFHTKNIWKTFVKNFLTKDFRFPTIFCPQFSNFDFQISKLFWNFKIYLCFTPSAERFKDNKKCRYTLENQVARKSFQMHHSGKPLGMEHLVAEVAFEDDNLNPHNCEHGVHPLSGHHV